MFLYVPTRAEIERVIDIAAGQAPELYSRLVHAGCILRAGDLTFDGEAFRCRSACDPQTVYAVHFGGCSCLDCASGRHLLHGEGCCSHRLALLVYCDICLAHLRGRLLGATTDEAARAAAAAAPNAGLLTLRYDEGRRLALVTCGARRLLPVPICQLHKVDGRLGFAAERDLGAFAHFLAQAQPLPKAPPAEPVEPAARSGRMRIPPALTVRLASLLI